MDNERWFVKVGNCYVAFLGLFHKPTMRSDYHKAEPFLSKDEATTEAKLRGVKNFRVVKKNL